LRSLHTLKNFKREIVIPELVMGHSDKKNMGTEEEMLINAKKKAKRILAEHKSPGYDPSLKRDLDAIFKKHADLKLKGKK